jgi:hypothetical protein
VNFADHLLQDVFQCDQAKDTAEFVHNHGQTRPARAEFDQKLACGLGLRNDEHVAEDASQVKLLTRHWFA